MLKENLGIRKPILDVLSGVALEKPPVWLMRQAGRYLPEYRKVRAEAGSFLDLCFNPALAAEVTLQPIRRFAMDAAILFSDILVIPHAMGQKLEYLEGEGPKLAPVRDRAGLQALRYVSGRLDPVLETVRRTRAELPPEIALIGFAGSPWTVAAYMVEGGGSRDFAATRGWAYSDPEAFGELIDRLVDASVEYLSGQIQAGADLVQLFDSWSGILAPDQFARWVIEPTKAIVTRLRAKHPGIRIIGFPRAAGTLIARYAAATGVDAVGLDTQVPLDLIRAELPSTPLQGNLDPIRLLTGGDALDRGIDDILQAMAGHPYIFNLGHGVMQPTPPEHVGHLVQRIRGETR